MMHNSLLGSALVSAWLLTSAVTAQTVVITHDSTNDVMVAFDPFDGHLVNASVFPMPDTAQVGSILVGNEIWVSEQTGDRVTRYDACGNVLGSMGPTLPGGGMDNIRGLTLIGGIVYVTNDGAGNGATADSLVTFDTAGNYLSTLPLSASPSPFAVIPFQGDLLVISSSSGDEIHRYTTAGVSLGQFYGGTTFGHQGIPSSDGNVWLTTFTGNTILKLDATNGNNVLQSYSVTQPRGVYELLNGNLLYTNSTGTWLYDVGLATSTQVYAGGNYHLNPVSLDFACHKTIGAGCHSFTQDNSNVFQFFTDVPSAKAVLDGNALQFINTGSGYVASWVPAGAAAYVPPSVGATIIANVSTGQETFTPSVAIPVPGGVTTTWTLSSEGILTAGSTGNQGTDVSPTLAETATQTGLAFYTWCTQNPIETSSGKFKWEEVGGMLYVTCEGVEFSGGTPTLAPSTYQWQVNTASGDVTMLWPSFSISTSTSDVLVGCTLAGTGITPTSVSLASVSNQVLGVDQVQVPMTLSASPNPVINPSTTVTYTANDVPEFQPGSGVRVGTLFLSVNPLPGGFDLNGILTTVPGCNAYIGSLDLDLGGAVSLSSSLSWTFTYDNVFFAPGNMIAAQAVALFDGAFPLLNGESGGFLLSNGLLSAIYPQ